MRLSSANGNALELEVVGYQFADDVDPDIRCSWHVVNFRAVHGEASWSVRSAALACHESPLFAMWLSALATRIRTSRLECRPLAALTLTEPDLQLHAESGSGGACTVRVGLDLEWHRDRAHWYAGDPYWYSLTLHADDIEQAAGDWQTEIARYPGLPSDADWFLDDAGEIHHRSRSR